MQGKEKPDLFILFPSWFKVKKVKVSVISQLNYFNKAFTY